MALRKELKVIHVHKLICVHLLVVICGTACTANQYASVPAAMSREQCERNEVCGYTGVVTIEEINHVFMGRLMLETGECVNLSLNDRTIKKIRKEGSKVLTVYGYRLPTPVGMHDVDFIKVDGRRIGWELCSDHYIFVKKVVEPEQER